MIQAHATIDFSIPAMRQWWKLPEGTLAEVINRTLYVSPSPTPYHGKVSSRIRYETFRHVLENDLGEMYDHPVDVYLKGGTDVVIPDIIFVSKDNSLIVDRKGLHGAPDLHIEILSPGTRKRDLTIKKKLYEESGVKEYWIVDPDTKNSQGYLLRDGKYGDPLLMNSEIYIRILKKIIRF